MSEEFEVKGPHEEVLEANEESNGFNGRHAVMTAIMATIGALLESAVQLASKGGADAVILREVTRQAGVAPNAAYRHFADHNALLQAVCACHCYRE